MVLGAALVCSHSVARAVVCWLPCCWLEEEVEPAAAMVAGAQKGEVVADCWGEGVEVASCPLEAAADLQGRQNSNQHKTFLSMKACFTEMYETQIISVSLPMGCP